MVHSFSIQPHRRNYQVTTDDLKRRHTAGTVKVAQRQSDCRERRFVFQQCCGCMRKPVSSSFLHEPTIALSHSFNSYSFPIYQSLAENRPQGGFFYRSGGKSPGCLCRLRPQMWRSGKQHIASLKWIKAD